MTTSVPPTTAELLAFCQEQARVQHEEADQPDAEDWLERRSDADMFAALITRLEQAEREADRGLAMCSYCAFSIIYEVSSPAQATAADAIKMHAAVCAANPHRQEIVRLLEEAACLVDRAEQAEASAERMEQALRAAYATLMRIYGTPSTGSPVLALYDQIDTALAPSPTGEAL